MDEEFIILQGQEIVKSCCLFSGRIKLGLQCAFSSSLMKETFILSCFTLGNTSYQKAEPFGDGLDSLLAECSHPLSSNEGLLFFLVPRVLLPVRTEVARGL